MTDDDNTGGSITWQNAGAFTLTAPEMWRATPHLKWVAPVASRPTAVLHQLWQSMTTGKQEWREVPMEVTSNPTGDADV